MTTQTNQGAAGHRRSGRAATRRSMPEVPELAAQATALPAVAPRR